MKATIKPYLLLVLLSFGQISCDSDKTAAVQADFNVRVFSHLTKDKQQLSSFGNSNLSVNDNLILYSAADLFPTWGPQEMRAYTNPHLSHANITVKCYGKDNQKSERLTTTSKSRLRVFEVVPEEVLLSDQEIISCEFLIHAVLNNQASVYIAKLLSVTLDVNSQYRLTTSEAPRVYLSANQFSEILEDFQFVKVDELVLFCEAVDKTHTKTKLITFSSDEIKMQSLDAEELLDKTACRLIYRQDEEMNFSEIFILKNRDLFVKHIFFTDYTGSQKIFYTFALTNIGDKTLEVKWDNTKILTRLTHYERMRYPWSYELEETIQVSKLSENKTFILFPNETVTMDVGGLAFFGVVDEQHNRNYSLGFAVTDIQVDFGERGLLVKERGDLDLYVGVKVEVDEALRANVKNKINGPYIRRR